VAEKSIPVGRLRWHCRRGTKELDRILGGYLEEDYREADTETQRAFVELLNRQDPDIYDWLMGAQVPAELNLRKLIARLQKKYGIDSGA